MRVKVSSKMRVRVGSKVRARAFAHLTVGGTEKNPGLAGGTSVGTGREESDWDEKWGEHAVVMMIVTVVWCTISNRCQVGQN